MVDSSQTIAVLHVDDEPDFLELTATLVERHDDRIVFDSARNVSEALDRLEKADFDCIVSDFEMPDRNGIEFLETVRQTHPYLPFILFTGKGSEDIASDAISAGVTDYLQKGGIETYDLLANRIVKAVSEYRSRTFEAVTKHDPLSLLDRFSDALFALNTEWEFTYANDAAAETFGRSVEALLGRNIWDLFPEAEETAFYRHYHQALEEGEGRTIEESYGPWDKWYREHIYPAKDGLTIASYDVTEQYERQKKLERLAAIIEASTSTVITVDATNTIVSVNSAVEETFGYTPDELVGERLTILMSEETADRHQTAFDRYLETGEKTLNWEYLEFDGRHRDGSTIPLSISFGDVEYQGERYLSGIIRDITDRRNYEAQLRELSQFQEAIIESANVWINTLDSEGNVVIWNKAAEEISGYTAEEVVGHGKVWEWLYPDEEYRQDILKLVSEILEGKQAVEEFETTIRTKTGEQRVISWYSRILSDESGELEGSVAVGRDVTDRKDRSGNATDRVRPVDHADGGRS